MTTESRDEIFIMLTKLSDLDPAVKPRLEAMLGRPNEDVKDELLGLIDDIVYCAWTSDFEVKVLHTLWCNIGGNESELVGRDTSRTPENLAKYKWQVAR